jgi:F0F1-type ATP synthase delta subunit
MTVIQPTEVGRLIQELKVIDESLLQLGLRHSGAAVQLPKTSWLLEQTAQLNKLNLLQTADRHQLQTFLNGVREHAPVLHISFSADPSPAFLEKLITWLRHEINPQVLLSIGLQPNMGAGCTVRSTNKYFDFSLRQDFARKHGLLKAALSTPVPPGGSSGE